MNVDEESDIILFFSLTFTFVYAQLLPMNRSHSGHWLQFKSSTQKTKIFLSLSIFKNNIRLHLLLLTLNFLTRC